MDGKRENTVGLNSPIMDYFGLGINQSVSEMPSAFSNMCERLTSIIAHGKIIQERTLLDFNRFVVLTIQNSVARQPEPFYELSTRIADYWHYELDDETNLNRKYSYIRLYQMIDTINAFYADQKVRNKVIEALDRQRKNSDIINLIQQYPGITCEKIQMLLPIQPEVLQTKLKELESDGFLYGRHYGSEHYYMLTNAGDILYETLMTSPKNTLDDKWDDRRRNILVFLLQKSENRNIKLSSVLRWIQFLLQLDDRTADLLLDQIYNGKYINDAIGNTEGFIQYEFNSPAEKLEPPANSKINKQFSSQEVKPMKENFCFLKVDKNIEKELVYIKAV